MSGQIVSESSPIVINNSTSNGSGEEPDFVDRIFKIALLVGLLAGLAIIGVVLFLAFNIWDAVGGTIEATTGFFNTWFRGLEVGLRLLPDPFEPLFGAFTAIGSAFFPSRRN
jgi:hypothetical protein